MVSSTILVRWAIVDGKAGQIENYGIINLEVKATGKSNLSIASDDAVGFIKYNHRSERHEYLYS